MWQEQLTQALALVDQVFPANTGASTVNSTGIDMQKFHRAKWDVLIGAMTASSTINIILQSSQQSNFNVAHNMTTNVSIAQVTTGGANTVVSVETTSEGVNNQNQLDRYARLQIVIGTAAANIGVDGYGGEANHKPASLQNNTTVVTTYTSSP